MKLDNKYVWASFKKKKNVHFLSMAEDKNLPQVSVPIRIVKRKAQESQVKLMQFAVR